MRNKAYKIRFILALIIFILAIAGITGLFYPVKIFNIQILPLLQRVFVDFSIFSAILLGMIILFTLLFGRFYCSILCPFGIFQEIFANIFNKKNKPIKNYPVKYFILVIVLGCLTGGSAFVLRNIEPYTYFGSTFTLSVLGICMTMVVVGIVFFKNRFFCTNICPAGTLLGILSKISLNKIYIKKDVCVSCGMCENNCPSGCINFKNKSVDNEICVKCLKCIGICPKGAIKFGKKPKENPQFSLKRRQILTSASVFLLFGLVIKARLLFKDKVTQKFREVILPPGGGTAEDFVNRCFNCNLCVSNCPNKIIVKSDENFPVIHLDLEKGYCAKDCNKCSQICPTGAIKRLTPDEKERTRIAIAMIDDDKCTSCGYCAKICPYGAIIKSDEKYAVDSSKCVGCGKCRTKCWHGAINIYGVKKQSVI